MVTTAAADRFLNAPLLSEVPPAARRAVLEVLVEGHAPAGALLMTQGQPNDHITFLIEGSVSIERALPDGQIETVARLMAPSVFGESSFFRPQSPPIVSARAATDVWLLTLDHPAHDLLRRGNPRAAEELALSAVRVLAERFDLLDKRLADYLAHHPDGPEKANEWAGFRARLFEESII